MTPATLGLGTALVAAALVAAALLGHARFTRASLAITGLSCVIAASGAARQLAGCAASGACRPTAATLWQAPPLPAAGGPSWTLTLVLDPLAAVFLLVVAVIGAAIAVYSLGWLREDPLAGWVAGSFALFVGAAALVVLVEPGPWLLAALELVTLFSADLARYRGLTDPATTLAGLGAVRTYLVVSHVSLVAVLVGLLPTLDGSPPPDGATGAVCVGLVLLGLAMRAGLFPFHVWVPAVHPHLPTNTHAMVSAVMLKLPVYLMIRLLIEERVGPLPAAWGAVLLLLATVTALVSVWHATVAADLKTALAGHSVENVAVIVAGLGTVVLFDGRHTTGPLRAAAAIALLAALFHTVNHALFKTLLFLVTGAIERMVGRVDLASLGGLLAAAPRLGWSFLVGAAAIAALPGLNGFVSEWLTLQAMLGGGQIFAGPAHVSWPALVALAVTVPGLAGAFAMTGMAFVKLSGDCLLGRPRTRPARGRPTGTVTAVPVALAVACAVLGVQPWLLLGWLGTAVDQVLPLGGLAGQGAVAAGPGAVAAGPGGLAVRAGGHAASLPVAPLLALWVVPALLAVATGARRVRRPVWAGGGAYDAATMQPSGRLFTAAWWERVAPGGLAEPPRGPLDEGVAVSGRRVVRNSVGTAGNRALAVIDRSVDRIGALVQSGDVRQYLLYICLGVTLALAIAITYPLPGGP